MKKLLLILLAMLLALPAFAEEASPTPAPTSDSVVEGYVAPATPTPAPGPELPPLRDDSMLQNVVEIAHRIDLLAESKLFRSYFVANTVPDEIVDKVSQGDHTRPVRVYHLNGQVFIDALYQGAEVSQIPDFTRPELRRDLVGELPEHFWGQRTAEEMHVLSVLSRYKVFALPGAEGCGVFFLLYQEASPVMVTWEACNDCVDVAAFFMPDERLAAVGTAEELSAWFAGFGMPMVAFEEVPLT